MNSKLSESQTTLELKNLQVNLQNDTRLKNINGGNIFDEVKGEDFWWGAGIGGATYDVGKTVVIETAEWIGENVYEGWSPADTGFLI